MTARQDGDAWCVAEVVETPTPPELIPVKVTGDYFDPLDAGDYTTATALPCDTYTGQSPEETAAITHSILKTANGTVFRAPTP